MALIWFGNPWKAHAENFGFEFRRGLIPKKRGIIRLPGYTNYANMGTYREAVERFVEGIDPVPDITAHHR